MRGWFVAAFLACFAMGCASGPSLIDRSELLVSESSRISAQNLIPYASRYPRAVEQLGMAQEVYHRKLFLLKARRDTLRSRTRVLNTLSYGTMAATTLGVGASAITSDQGQSQDGLRNAGYAALGGLAAGTIFQTLGYMQEDTGSIDSKIRHLDLLYDTMVERLRQLSTEGEFAKDEGRGKEQLQSEMGAAIESFVSAALAINVKG